MTHNILLHLLYKAMERTTNNVYKKDLLNSDKSIDSRSCYNNELTTKNKQPRCKNLQEEISA